MKTYDPDVIDNLKDRYKHLHLLIFHRSLERAKSLGDLFDILESVPKTLPLLWCEIQSRWKSDCDLFLSEEFFKDQS